MEQKEQVGTPTRNTKNRSWVFTWNNYTNEDIEYLIKYFKEKDRYVFGEEIGNSGTPHLQGVVNFSSPRTFNSVKKLFKNNHIEVCKNWNASCKYCSKDGQTYTNIKKLQSRRERLLAKYNNVIWKDWQQNIIDICETEPNDRTINWIWEEEGNKGKSFLAKYLVLKHDAIVCDGKKDNVFNQLRNWIDCHKDNEDPKVIILDVPRYNLEYVNFGCLEQIKNGMVYSGKYEGGLCLFESPHIIIFANAPPDEDKLSEDRWNIIEL